MTDHPEHPEHLEHEPMTPPAPTPAATPTPAPARHLPSLSSVWGSIAPYVSQILSAIVGIIMGVLGHMYAAPAPKPAVPTSAIAPLLSPQQPKAPAKVIRRKQQAAASSWGGITSLLK